MSFELNKRIMIKDGFSGIVRYIGGVEGKAGEWVGIELDSAVGSNDGSYCGRRYFTCPPRYGVFIRTQRLVCDTGRSASAQHAGAPNDSCMSYAIREKDTSAGRLSTPSLAERKDAQPAFSKEPYDPSKWGTNTSRSNPEARDAFDPNRSLFGESEAPCTMAPIGSSTEKKHLLLEEENIILREQAEQYKVLFFHLMKVSKETIGRVSSEMADFSERLRRLSKYKVEMSERDRVVALVSEICRGSCDPKRMDALYNEFKGIVGKYNIRIE